VLSSDEVVHRLIAADPEVRAALEERFGTTERARIAEIVFADPGELSWLESLLHPPVRSEVAGWLAELERLPEPPDIAAVEIPLLFEGGAEERFDAVVVITAPEELRRLRAGRKVDERSDRLIPDDEKVRRADFAYVNDGTPEELEAFVNSVLGVLKA
jgi:dephospho-CoA kinase